MALTVATKAKREHNFRFVAHNRLTKGFEPFNAPSRLPEVVRQKARRTLQVGEYAVTSNGTELE